MANRLAYILRLDREDPEDSPVIRENKSRVWWTLVMADNWCSAGLGIPRQLPQHNTTLSLPIDEHIFYQWPPGGGEATVIGGGER